MILPWNWSLTDLLLLSAVERGVCSAAVLIINVPAVQDQSPRNIPARFGLYDAEGLQKELSKTPSYLSDHFYANKYN